MTKLLLSVALTLIFSIQTFAATKCIITTTDKETGEIKTQFMRYSMKPDFHGSAGERLYTYKNHHKDDYIRIQFSTTLAHKIAKFKATKINYSGRNRSTSYNHFCEANFEDGSGVLNCPIDHLNVNIDCSQIVEGDFQSQFEISIALREEQNKIEKLASCGLNLDVEFKNIEDNAQAELMDNIFSKVQEKGAILVNKDQARVLDVKMTIEKRFLSCKAHLEGNHPADENQVSLEKAKSRNCEKAVEKILNKMNSCN